MGRISVHMFAEHAFDVKHLAVPAGLGSSVTPPRDHRRMALVPSHALVAVPVPAVPAAAAPIPAATASPSARPIRLPESVYRRRRVTAALIGAAALTLALTVGRPDGVPLGEANPWPSVGEASLPAELPGVYVVQPGDTLWDIVRAVAPGTDPRARIHELAEALGGAGLEPGQRIVLDAGSASELAGRSGLAGGSG